jgi:glutathione S-transferase
MATLQLISFDICPYVERCRVVLHEKGLAFEQTQVDLTHKPEWFLRISPRGKVPVLLFDGQPVFESSVINELLEELQPSPPLWPTELLARAQARAWVAWTNEVLQPALGKLWYGPVAQTEAAHTEVQQAIGRLDEALAARTDGPYFLGGQFSMVDATLAPCLTRRQASLQLGLGDPFDATPRLQAWAEAVLARPSVVQAQADGLTAKVVAFVERLRSR